MNAHKVNGQMWTEANRHRSTLDGSSWSKDASAQVGKSQLSTYNLQRRTRLRESRGWREKVKLEFLVSFGISFEIGVSELSHIHSLNLLSQLCCQSGNSSIGCWWSKDMDSKTTPVVKESQKCTQHVFSGMEHDLRVKGNTEGLALVCAPWLGSYWYELILTSIWVVDAYPPAYCGVIPPQYIVTLQLTRYQFNHI